jgi:aspartate/methionine/tyrosine aminotransferase
MCVAPSVENVSRSRIRAGESRWEWTASCASTSANNPDPDYITGRHPRYAGRYTFYTENAGLPTLRRALAGNYRRLHGVDLDPATEIVITASGVQALNVGIRCTLDPGDEALVLTPAWPNGSSCAMMANAVVRQVPHPLCGDRYVIDFDALERAVTPRTRLLLYTSPSNPLGWVATEPEQRALLDFARRHDLWLIADEVYDRLYYAGASLGEPVPSILRLATRDDAVMVVHSFSKSYCMTGWRVGWLIARRDAAAKATELNEFIISHAPSFAQKAAETALSDGEPELHGMLERLKELNLCWTRCGAPSVTVPKPDGAFYLSPASTASPIPSASAAAAPRPRQARPGVAFGAGARIHPHLLCRGTVDPRTRMERLNRFLSGS